MRKRSPSGWGLWNSHVDVCLCAIICSYGLPKSLVWVEHWPRVSTDGGEETFDLVVFSSYEVTERAPYLDETRAWIGDATWKRLDRATVEVLVGGKV